MDLPELQRLIVNLRKTGQAAGRLAQNDTTFRAALDAFRAEDAESFQRLLGQLEIGLDCERVCGWFCSKECLLECIELCGPPQEFPGIEQIPRFAEIIAKITGDEELIERLANAIQDRDRASFQSLVSELEIGPFCHLLCHWACMIRCRLVCEVVCAPSPIARREFVVELGAGGAAIRRLAENRETLDQVVKGAAAFDCELVASLIGGLGDCIFICEWICSWRCVLVCLPLCREFAPLTETSIEEMRAFAVACERLAAQDEPLRRLVEAIQAENLEAFSALIKELKFDRFCLQLCHWVCGELCSLFCECVCPRPETIPMFTHVGVYRVDPIWNDFAVDGTTTAGGLAFTQTIPLRGILPDGSTPTPMEYRFTTEKYPLGGGPQVVTAGMIPATVIGALQYWEWAPGWVLRSAQYWVNNPGATVSINQPGPPLIVSVNKDVGVGGWIPVPREDALFFGGVGRFVPQGGLANLDTTKLTDEQFDLTVAAPPLPLQAGDTVPAAQKSEKPHFKITFESRNAVSHAGISANDRPIIALSDTHYRYTRHPDWNGGAITEILVLSLDIAELRSGGGCVPLQTHVHALFTAYHPYLGTCDVHFQGPPPLPPSVVPPISALGEAVSPGGGQDFNITGLNPCAYIVWLEATLKLTVGNGPVYGTFSDQIAFCKR